MKNSVFTLLLVSFWGIPAYGQTYIQNTMYHFSQVYYNPASVGMSDDEWKMTMLGRYQWVGFNNAPKLYAVSIDRGYEDFGGVGLQVMQDELGPLKTTSISAAYSFPINLNVGTLRIGVQGGYSQKSLNAVWKYRGIDDPLIGAASNAIYSASAGAFNLAAGLFYMHENDRFYVGLAGQNLLEPSIEALLRDPGLSPNSKVPRTFYFTGGYRFDLAEDESYLQPALMLRTDGAVTQMDLSMYVKYKVLHLGANYRGLFKDSESLGFITGFEVNDRTMIGYSYDYGLGRNGGLGQSHELVLTYKFGVPEKEGEKDGNILEKEKSRGLVP